MFDLIKVDPDLANAVEREMLSTKPKWQYLAMTTNYFDITKNEDHKRSIEILRQQYPVIDTQKFSDTIFNSTSSASPSFIEIRRNPNSRYNKDFPNAAKLLDYLQSTYIPKQYVVKRFLVNMQTIRSTWTLNEIHPDFSSKDFVTILYYVNSSDGDTLFFEGSECVQRVEPVKGTAVMYPSVTLHAGSTPTKHETRVVINLVFGPR